MSEPISFSNLELGAKLVSRMSPGPWREDEAPREGGADQIVDPNDLTICFMSTPAEEHEADMRGIVWLRNHADALLKHENSLLVERAMRRFWMKMAGALSKLIDDETTTLYISCPKCAGSGYVRDGDGIEDNCDLCVTRGFATLAAANEWETHA